MAEQIQVGDIARDTITGFEGVVVCESRWLNGCVRLTLQPKTMKNGKPIASETIDVTQLRLVRATGHSPYRKTGGPRPEPKGLPSPTR